MSSVISVRVPKRLKEEAERLGINIRHVVEESLRHAIAKEKRRRVAEALRELADAGGELSVKEWIKAIRASREGRRIT